MARTLRVLLNQTPVGELQLDAQERCEFKLLESYKAAYPRPVLGQVFLDDLNRIHHTRARTPPWFSNLLPEGPLRELIAAQAQVHPAREFFLLRHLGEDLPGAVRIVDNEPWTQPEEGDLGTSTGDSGDLLAETWHFSLAGVQLKFSARRTERGLTIPVSGRGGDWIVKLPDTRFDRVPENEYATMRWAEASGIPIPEMALVRTVDIVGLPSSYNTFPEPYALAVRRFDRPSLETRVHMEDFAQILDLYPEEKYKKFSYDNLARLILILAGEEDLRAFLHRLVFIVACGNGDAHHKNWTLIYPEPVSARLSPAYDLVSTIQYQPDDRLALNLGGTKRWEEVNGQTFLRMAEKIGVDEKRMESWIADACADVMQAWSENGEHFGYTKQARARIVQHFSRIPLLRSF